MSKLPFIHLYKSDWKSDPNLSKCSPATRGIWVDLIFTMDDLDRTGLITGTAEQLSRACRCSELEMRDAIAELAQTKTADVTERNGIYTVINRRMQREHKARMGGAQRQAKMRENGGGDPEKWTAIRAPILIRDNKICAYCGRKAVTVDHVIPKTKGGTHEPGNLVACCKPCNTKKGNRTPFQAQMSFFPSFNLSVLNDEALAAAGLSRELFESDVGVTPPLSLSESISKSEEPPPSPPNRRRNGAASRAGGGAIQSRFSFDERLMFAEAQAGVKTPEAWATTLEDGSADDRIEAFLKPKPPPAAAEDFETEIRKEIARLRAVNIGCEYSDQDLLDDLKFKFEKSGRWDEFTARKLVKGE